EVEMLTSTKSGVPEKDKNASVSAAEVMGRVAPHDQTWARSEPTTKAGTASCIGSDMSIVGNIECKGPAQVFGRIEGEVRASDLQINDGAQVEGSVIAQNVRQSAAGSRALSVPSASRPTIFGLWHLPVSHFEPPGSRNLNKILTFACGRHAISCVM